MFNAVATLAQRARPHAFRLDAHAVVRAAKARAQTQSELDAGVRQRLDIVIESIRRDAALSPFGHLFLRDDLVQRVANRLRLQDYLARNPQVTRVPVVAPLFVLGLPRTGTTLLQRLLAQDPAHRALTPWEMSNPIPPPEPGFHGARARIAAAERKSRIVNYVVPELRRMHEHSGGSPEECFWLMANDLHGNWLTVAATVPSYTAWFYQQDLTDLYRIHRQWLQVLSSRWMPQRWLLKAPLHVYGLEWLLATYPDARVVWTHRDPLAVIPSLASLHFNIRAAFSPAVDAAAVGRETLEELSTWLRRGERARADLAASDGRIVDVRYDRLVADPMREVRRIYDAFGIALGDEAEQRMRDFIAANPKDKHGPHRYALAEFGLTAEDVRERFAASPPRWAEAP